MKLETTTREIERAKLAQVFVHEQVCAKVAPGREHPCLLCPSGSGLVLTLRALDASPRDAQRARLILHDRLCMSGCTGPAAAEHAQRQVPVVAALRKFRAREAGS
jgi:hypothetical protein